MDTKNFTLQIKSLDESGTFEGKLAVYGNVDGVGDVIENGAFTKTLQEGGSSIPLLWSHDQAQPIGTLELRDSPTALLAKGKLVLSVPQAKIAYDLLKAGAIKGLSIGFNSIKDVMDGSIRRLKEIRLWEGSLVAVPANSLATVTAVKTQQPDSGDAVAMFKNASRDTRDFYRRLIDGD